MFRMLDSFFRFTWNFQQVIMRSKSGDEKLGKIMEIIKNVSIVSFAIAVILLFCNAINENTFTNWFVLYVIIQIMISVVDKGIKVLASVRGFLTWGIGAVTGISLIIFTLFIESGAMRSTGENYLGFCFITSIVWSLFCCFCNAKVATLVNSCLAVLAGLIVSGKRILWLCFFENVQVEFSELQAEMQLHGYTPEQYLSDAIDICLFPLIYILAFGAISTAVKMYWIEVYNEGKDINRELVM